MSKFIITLLVMFMPFASQALIELRAGYGVNTLEDDNYLGSQLENMTGFNVDVIFEPPLLTDLGLGLRYETMGFDAELGGATVSESSMNRLSALINYRIIDFIAYFGVISTLGISTEFESEAAGVTTSYDEKFNYSLGIEGGMNIGLFSIGGEVGKFFAKVENPGSADLDLESVYVKVLVGIDF